MKIGLFSAFVRRFASMSGAAAIGILLSLSLGGIAGAQTVVPQSFVEQPALVEAVQDEAAPAADAADVPDTANDADVAETPDESAASEAPAAEAEEPVAPAAGTGVSQQASEPALPRANEAGSSAVDLPMVETGMGHDLSPLGMFMMADIVVKAVMVGLATAALVTWIIWLGKSLQLMGAKGRARRALRIVAASPSLADSVTRMERRRGVGALLVRAANEEIQASADLVGRVAPSGIKERVSSRLTRIEVAAGRKMSQGTGILASIGSVAPFVGLFGTVWGIMNSFISIAESQTTNLAVVAPGIAEALLATAIGLVAAIPAVIIYNVFARSVTGYRQLLADVSAAIERLVSRDLDRQALTADTVGQAQAAE